LHRIRIRPDLLKRPDYTRVSEQQKAGKQKPEASDQRPENSGQRPEVRGQRPETPSRFSISGF
jgi:hypothetical protein